MLALFTGCSRESRLTRHLDRANRYFQARQYDKAEIEYLNVLSLDSRHTFSAWHLGQIYYEEGKINRAYAYLSRAKQAQPDYPEGRLTLGFCFIYGKMFKEAREEALFVLRKQPGSDEALMLLADAAISNKEIEDTRQRLQALRPEAGNKAGLHVALGTLALRQKDLAGAEAALNQGLALDQKSRAAHLALGNLYLQKQQTALAGQSLKTAAELSPVGSNWRLQYANFKIQTGDVESGKRLLEQMTKEAPYFLPAWNRRAEVALGERKYDECAGLINKVLARDAANFDALMLSGRLQVAQRDPAKATAAFERVDKIYPGVPEVQYQWGLACLLNNEPAKAEARLSQAVALEPAYPEAVLVLAELKIKKGDLAAALTLLGQLIQQRPKLGPAYLLLAKAHLSQNRLDEAFADYRRLAEIFPKNPESHFLLGQVLLTQGKQAEARKAFTQALALAPNYLPAFEQIINLDIGAKQYAAALQQVQAQFDKNPKSPDLQLFTARIYHAQGDDTQTEAALLKAIEWEPTYRPAYMLLARMYIDTKKHPQALERLQSVVARNPKDQPALMQLGMLHNELKNFTAARDTYLKLLAVNPQFSPALNNLAYLYSEQFRELDKAYDMARRARELLPVDPFTADTLGWILFKRGDYARALPLLQESAERLSAEPEVQFHLGMSHYMLCQEEPARVALQRAAQATNNFPGKAEAQRRLALLTLNVQSSAPNLIAELEQRVTEDASDPILPARLAALYERDGNFSKAIKNYERALKLTPKNASAMAHLGCLYADHLHDNKKALELAQAAHQLLPEDPLISLALGRLAYQSSDYQWAASLLQQSASRLPQSPEARYWLAFSHLSLGRVQEAQTEMRNLLQLGLEFPQKQDANRFLNFLSLAEHPETAPASNSQIESILKSEPEYLPALWAAARLHQQRREPSPAAQLYEKILARYPAFFPANKQLALWYAQQAGQTEKAYPHALKAQRALPQDPDLAKVLGILVYLRGEYPRSVQLLSDISKTQTADPEIFYYLGMAHYRLKDKTQSKQALRQALALNVNERLAAEAKRVLAELQ